MVRDPDTVWIGLEYFCNVGDELWRMRDSEMMEFAAGELVRLGMIDRDSVLDGTVIRVPRTYPAYFGSYDQFPVVRAYTDSLENLFLIGRNGMHRYNNQDHSMLTAMAAVENLAAGRTSKENIWAVNAERQYHEEQHSHGPDHGDTPAFGDEPLGEMRAYEAGASGDEHRGGPDGPHRDPLIHPRADAGPSRLGRGRVTRSWRGPRGRSPRSAS